MRKRWLSLGLVGLVPGLTGCYTVKSLDFKVVAPLGATAVALATYAGDLAHVTTASDTAVVRSAFFGNQYDVIIFDTFTGLNLIQNQKAPFKLARVLTLGNLYLVSSGQDPDGQLGSDDFLVSFSQGLMPDKIFKMLHPEYQPDYYFASAALARSGLCAGQANGKTIDYAVLSEPFVYSVQQDKNCPNGAAVTVVEDLKETFKQQSGELFGESLRGFPQAGLFISERLENSGSQRQKLKNFLRTIDADLRDLERAGAQNVAELLLRYGDLASQTARFGLTYQTLSALQYDAENRQVLNKLAYNSFPVDLDKFADDYQAALSLVDINPTSYSSYYHFVEAE